MKPRNAYADAATTSRVNSTRATSHAYSRLVSGPKITPGSGESGGDVKVRKYGWIPLRHVGPTSMALWAINQSHAGKRDDDVGEWRGD